MKWFMEFLWGPYQVRARWEHYTSQFNTSIRLKWDHVKTNRILILTPESDERFDTQLSESRDEWISEATRRTWSKRTATLNASLLSQAVIDDESDSDWLW